MKRVIKDTIYTILILIIVVLVYLYAKDGRLTFGNLRDDFKEAVSLKGERIEERLNYNPIEPEELVQKLKAKNLVVGEPEEIGTTTLGAKRAVKINVEGYDFNFYIIDWDKAEEDPYIQKTKEDVETKGQVFVEGKYYDAYVNKTALITKLEKNPKRETIIKVFKSIEGLSYDQMVSQRNDNSLNPAVTTVDKVLDGFEFAISEHPDEEKYNKLESK